MFRAPVINQSNQQFVIGQSEQRLNWEKNLKAFFKDWVSRHLILSQLDSDWKIIPFLISLTTIVGLWVLGNCRGINCGQIWSLNKTCFQLLRGVRGWGAAHKSHSYPFPPTTCPSPLSHTDINFPRFKNNIVAGSQNMMITNYQC